MLFSCQIYHTMLAEFFLFVLMKMKVLCALQCVSWADLAGTSKRTLHLHIDGSVTCPDHSGLVKKYATYLGELGRYLFS